jgi:hypothetical protein
VPLIETVMLGAWLITVPVVILISLALALS